MTKNEIPPLEKQARKLLRRFFVLFKKYLRKLIIWLFFYKADSKMEEIRHILDVLVWIYLTYRLVLGR